MTKKMHPNSIKNLLDRSAPDNPGPGEAITVRLTVEQVEWLRSQPEGNSFHVRSAMALYLRSFFQSLEEQEIHQD